MTPNHSQHKHDLGYEIKEPIVHMIVVSLHNQSLHALDKNCKKIFSYNCATGDENNRTKKGAYHVNKRGYTLEEASKHESGEFKGAKMPYPMYIDSIHGVAIHGSGLISKHGLTINTHLIQAQSYLKMFGANYFGSHGCIRLSVDDALELYLHTPQGTKVVVRDLWINED